VRSGIFSHRGPGVKGVHIKKGIRWKANSMDLELNGNGSQVKEMSLLRISSCKRDENLKLVLEGNQKFKNVLQVSSEAAVRPSGP